MRQAPRQKWVRFVKMLKSSPTVASPTDTIIGSVVVTFIDTGKIGRFQILVAALCAMVVLLDGLNTQVIGYLGPVLSNDWDLSRAALGPIFSASLAGLMSGLLVINRSRCARPVFLRPNGRYRIGRRAAQRTRADR
jgi:hypothetical protein